MNNKNYNGFLDLSDAARFLKCSEEELLKLVREKKIPHSITPLGKILFDRERLREWVLSFEQMPEYRRQGVSATPTGKISLTEEICRRFGYVTRASNRYINLCVGQIVFAQVHPRRTGDGVDLALRECGGDSSLHECTVLKRIDIRELGGYWRTNKNWLEGKRFTSSPAAAFHVPSVLADDPENIGWSELENMLEYTKKKMMGK